MATAADWMKEAEEQAKRYSDTLKQNNQYLIDQLNQSKQNTLNQLQAQQDNAIYNLNTNKAGINQTATDNAKQLNVARLLALKNNQQAMNRAGLGTQGVVGSQVNEINNDYGTNLTSVLNQQTNDLRNLEKEKNNTLLTYNTNRLNLENEYGNNLANLQQSINDRALSQYNTVYNNVLNMKQQEYANQKAEEQRLYEQQQAELARQEAIRQYNESLELQKAQLEHQKHQDEIANVQKWAQIQAAQQPVQTNDFTDEQEVNDNNTSSSNGVLSTILNTIKNVASNVKSQSSNILEQQVTNDMKNIYNTYYKNNSSLGDYKADKAARDAQKAYLQQLFESNQINENQFLTYAQKYGF